MQKKFLTTILAGLMAFSLSACSLESLYGIDDLKDSVSEEDTSDSDEDSEDDEDPEEDRDSEDDRDSEEDKDSEDEEDSSDSEDSHKRAEAYEVFCIVRELDPDGNPNFTLDSVPGQYVPAKDLSEMYEEGSIVIDRSHIKSAEAVIDASPYGVTDYMISVELNERGTELFAEATSEAFANGESMFMVSKGEVISAPKVQGAISDGMLVVTGFSSMDECREVAKAIKKRR
jgi:hypothetical protein